MDWQQYTERANGESVQANLLGVVEFSKIGDCICGIPFDVWYDSMMIYLVLDKWVSSLYILVLPSGFSMMNTIILTLMECPFTEDGYGVAYLSFPYLNCLTKL